jgi:DNA (cytosine-5)-methyltransferase 1
MLTIATLFSGGLDGFAVAAAERSDQYRLIWQCENDKFRQKMLTDAFGVRVYDDVTTILTQKPETPDVLIITSPCQDFTACNTKGTSDTGKHSKLIYDAFHVWSILRPQYIVLENSPNLLNRGGANIFSEIAALGYDAEWQCITAAALGAKIHRDRLFIVCATKDRRNGLFRRYEKVGNLHKGTCAEKNIASLLISRLEQIRYHDSSVRTDGIQQIPTELRAGNAHPTGITLTEINKRIAAVGDAVHPLQAGYILDCITFHHNQINQTQ